MVLLNIGRKTFTYSLFWLTSIVSITEAQEYKLTGSAAFAVLGNPFTWTCEMNIPNGTNAVKFYRSDRVCAIIGYIKDKCYLESYNDRYTYECLPESMHQYTLTLPAENMTEFEQSVIWYCESADGSYASPKVSLRIAIGVHNVSLIPNDNPLTIREGTQKVIQCVVNSNAAPTPTITWYLGSTNITSSAGTDTISITLTGNRMDTKNLLQCIATNNNNPPKTASTTLNVEYPPKINTLSQQDIIEGRDLLVTCQATPGNPSSTTFYWTKEDNTGFRQNGATLQLTNIQRTGSGTYRCTSENMYSNGEKGSDSQSLAINVLYPPTIDSRQLPIVNESEKVILTRNISSNPLSKVSWYSKTELLKTQTSVTTASFIIARATCSDTQNFTLVASNGVGSTVTAVVELIVNCKPMPDKTNITIGATFTTGIEFSTTILAYPEPLYELEYENGTRNNQMMNNITRNAVNNFTVYFRQPIVDKRSFGLYYLILRNLFGESTVIVNVIEQRTGIPETPRNVAVVCEITQARVQWISSFNGGDQQYFTVIILNGQDGTKLSYRFHDKGENEPHVAHVSNLQPSVTYWFVVSAKNSYGSSPSEITRCKTVHG